MKLPSFLSIFLKKLSRLKAREQSLSAFNFDFIFGGILLLAILAEIILAYGFLYQNLIFSDLPQSVTSAKVTRINTENYILVKARLQAVENYNSSSTIDFAGKLPGIGRSNPFADPQ